MIKMINTNYEKHSSYDFALVDRSYPSEETILAVDVFQLETILADYNASREADDEYEFEENYFFGADEDEREMLRELEAELLRKRERLAFIKQ